MSIFRGSCSISAIPRPALTPGPATSRDLAAMLHSLGLERAVIVQPTPYGADNRCLIDALGRLAGRARGVIVLETPVTGQELSALNSAGVRGIRVNLETVGANDPKAAARDIIAAATVRTEKGNFIQLNVPDYGSSNRIGDPKLPMLRKLIEIPVGANPSVKVKSYTITDYKLSDYGITYPLIPVQPSVSKNPNKQKPKFQYNDITYSSDHFNSDEL